MTALPGQLALTTISDGGAIIAADHRNNYAAIQTPVNSLITALGAGLSGQVLGLSPAATAPVYPPGTLLGSGSRTTDVNVTATTSAGATDLTISTGAVTYDGTAVLIHFFTPDGQKGTNTLRIVLYDGATELGEIARAGAATTMAMTGWAAITPSAGSHTYNARGYVDAGTGVIGSGAGTIGTKMPSFIRVYKV